MPARLSPHAPQVLRDYYRVLEAGADAYAHGAHLRPLLTDHLDFTGPLAGHRPDATDGFLHGVSGFVATVERIDVLQDVHDDAGSAVTYIAVMPGGPMTFSEFFTFEENRIAALRLQYDGAEYIAKGGR